jgi:hypothetical protein
VQRLLRQIIYRTFGNALWQGVEKHPARASPPGWLAGQRAPTVRAAHTDRDGCAAVEKSRMDFFNTLIERFEYNAILIAPM